MRYKIFLFFAILIFTTGLISAATCSDNQRIMRLYQINNSHGALWNYTSGYNIEICSPNGENVEHSANPVLWLGASNNSHASSVQSSFYNVPIGFGNELDCSVIDINSQTCSGDIVLSLYKLNNSHLAQGNVNGYDYKVCCGAVVGGAYWADANGNPLTPASSQVGDSVKLIVDDAGLADGTLVNFSVEEKNLLGDDEIFGASNPIVGKVINNDAVGVWRITQADYDKTSSHDKYAFATASKESNEMSISGTGNDSPIRLKILEPLCGENLTMGAARNVKVDVSDIDDIVTGKIAIDGSTYNVTNGVSTFNHIFNNAGNIQIVLSGNNTRGEMKQTITNIIVINPSFDDVYVAACIDSPEDYADIEESIVLFNATSTRAMRCTGSVCSEIAGKTFGNWNALTFHWTFSDGRTHPYPQGSNALAHLFYKTFTQAGDNWAELVAELVG